MSEIFFTVAANTAPTRSITLQHDGSAINLTGASVDLIIKHYGTSTITNSGHQSCTLSATPIDGTVTYTPLAADFPSEGLYTGDAKITYPGGAIETLYEQLVVIVRE